MRTIHLISNDSGSELIARGLKSLFTAYNCSYSPIYNIKTLHQWQLNELMAGNSSLILVCNSIPETFSLLARYNSVRAEFYLWQFLSPSFSKLCASISEIEASAKKYPKLKCTYLMSREFSDSTWKNLVSQIASDALAQDVFIAISKPQSLAMVPEMSIRSLAYKDQLNNDTDSIVAIRCRSSEVVDRKLVLDTILNQLPSHKLMY